MLKIDTLIRLSQVSKKETTYVRDCDASITRVDDFGYKFHVVKHSDLNASASLKTFKDAINFMYKK